jgi:hypothetical protein
VPVYLSIHRSPGLSEEEIAGYAPDVKAAVHAQFQQLFVNLDEGYIVTLYQGDSEEAVHAEFERIGWPWDTTTEIQFSLDAAGLDAITA